ncbi:hypothetical protein FNT36_19760 [Hymenobacter setariae]|uniref:Right handed beta helix domain-containing protein n=1 Tax=Hymenobacter setariae TaxID=2594794 RepID=A0A558BPI3_9BACT|nr:hypothetical protein [Hymenobacter setariae]TVT38429.1 hypothetical protein FNT36_19760 [Hymenobacter setariae]
MKNTFTSLFAALLLLCTCAAQAQTIRRVNNSGLNVTGVNVYATLQDAHDASSSGDIIYLEPTSISYGNLTCVRPLTIIGNGYFLDQNPALQLDKREAIVGTVYFNNGSAGSRITGCTINSTIYITASNITVERNNLNTTYIGYNGNTVTVSGIIFRQNYATGYLYLYPNTNTTVSNVNITNNIFNTGSISTSGQFARMSNILISNNVIGTLAGTSGYGIDVDNAVIKNNIITYTGTSPVFTPRNNAYSYNISGNTAFGTANGNQQNVTPANLFVGGTASTDGAYQLRTGSPAIGTGESGTDVGAFGGVLPYRIAGIPNVPTIYQYNQSVSGNTLNATISTRSNN